MTARMKRHIIILILLLTGVAARAQFSEQELVAVWDRANTAYANADYSRAIVTYDSLVVAGYTGKKLYYNLGNAWFKNGGIGRAILNYNRALKIDPSDPDTRHNLKIANAHIKDNIEAVPEFFLASWIRSWRRSMSTDAWAVVSLVTLAVMLAAILVFLLSNRLLLRKTGFYTALAAFAICMFAVYFSIGQKRDIESSDNAIVTASAIAVHSSPDKSSKEIFMLHEGTKVEILESLGEWKEIAIADGNKGWIHRSAIEII